jgi:hypothetical protein
MGVLERVASETAKDRQHVLNSLVQVFIGSFKVIRLA